MKSTYILLDNLIKNTEIDSIRSLTRKFGYSSSVFLNWSSGRSSPSLGQLNHIAYLLGVEISELLIYNNKFTLNTPIWKSDIEKILKFNLELLKIEKDINEYYFYKNSYGDLMSYRTFIRYINESCKNINLHTLDKFAQIFDVKTYELLERRYEYEKN